MIFFYCSPFMQIESCLFFRALLGKWACDIHNSRKGKGKKISKPNYLPFPLSNTFWVHNILMITWAKLWEGSTGYWLLSVLPFLVLVVSLSTYVCPLMKVWPARTVELSGMTTGASAKKSSSAGTPWSKLWLLSLGFICPCPDSPSAHPASYFSETSGGSMLVAHSRFQILNWAHYLNKAM
jgi:hypothetical protein